MVCLDTDFLVAITRKDNTAIQLLNKLKNLNEEIYITSLTAAELFEGAYAATAPKRVEELKTFLYNFKVYDFTYSIAEVFGKLLITSKKSGYTIKDMDALIAAICIVHNETLITRDKDFQNIEGLKTELW